MDPKPIFLAGVTMASVKSKTGPDPFVGFHRLLESLSRHKADVKNRLNASRTRMRVLARTSRKALRRRLALIWRQINFARFYLSRGMARNRGLLVFALTTLLLAASAALAIGLRASFDAFFSVGDRIALLRTLLVTLGGALIGATAIGFSVVMFAVQINFARMPHGLFRQLSSDARLLGAFATTFLLAFGVAALSLIPGAHWAAAALIASVWATLLILMLFLFAYKRALALINPLYQLGILTRVALKTMRTWVRRAIRSESLLQHEHAAEEPSAFRSTHDMARTAFFQANPHWTATPRQAVTHAIAFARRYAEQGDHDVAAAALNAVVAINAAYVAAKGKTFFAQHLMFDNPLATDGTINEALEHLRQNARIAITRGDEEQIEQTFRAFAALVRVYMSIDYSSPALPEKQHAQLAASYLSAAVQAAVPHNIPDVLIEGVRLMGQSAQLFLSAGQPNEIVILADKIAAISAASALKEEFRPVTLTGVEQLARLTFDLIRTKDHDIRYAAGEIKRNVLLVAKMLLTVPDAPLSSAHSTFLAPYYSLTKTQVLADWLAALANELNKAEPGNRDAAAVLHNIEQWAEELYRSEKELLLVAIERRSQFTFDIIHWIAHVTKILVFVSGTPACDDHTQRELIKHARWLISVLSWIPEDRKIISFVENFQFTETVFEVALDAHARKCGEVYEAARDILTTWAMRGDRHKTGWAILERSIYGLATLALWGEAADEGPRLRAALAASLGEKDAPNQELRDHAARNIRRRAQTLHRPDHWSSRIENAMARVDHAKLQALLQSLADVLSPSTADEPATLSFL
jgi:hypothetical protein